ncbi:hypothetical protein JYP51_17340 [Ponticoccus gilvus]|nr:hypothetical protein [Enemella evansiae]
MSTEDGQRFAAERRRLEDKRKDLEDALMRLNTDESDADRVVELAQEVELLEQEVERMRSEVSARSKENDMTKTKPAKSPDDVRKAAAANRQAAERQLDELAKQMQQPGETFEKVYSRALDTDMGRSLMQTRDDAAALEVGGITSMDIEKARKSLAR